MSTWRRPAGALLLALGFVVAGCGGNGAADPVDTRPQARAAPTTTGPTPVPAEDVVAEPSTGCEAGPGAAASSGDQTLSVGGEERRYLRHLPPAHDGATPVPLVVDLHGYIEGAVIHARHTGLSGFGDQAGFVTVTPQGQGPVPFWTIGFDDPDVEFVGALLDAEEASLCLDTNRIFVTGLSNGAFLTSAVACVLEDRIAAVAPVAGVLDLEGCEPDRAVPVVAFHGTDDEFVPYDGGWGPAVDELPAADGSGETLEESGDLEDLDGAGSVPAVMAAWAGRNGCGTEPDEEMVAEDVTRLSYDCPAGATTELYRIEGGGHSWPGSEFSARIEDVVGTTTFSIDANEVMWAFFEAHPLPPA